MLDIVPSAYPKFRAGSMWNPQVIDILCERWDQGISASRIAIELGEQFTKNAVIGKAHRLGLELRKTGFKPGDQRASPASRYRSKYSPTELAEMKLAVTRAVEGAREMRSQGIAYGKIGRQFGYSDQWAYKHTRDVKILFPRPKAKYRPQFKSAYTPGQKTAPYVPKSHVFDVTPGANRVKLIDHKEGQCRWPLGDPLHDDFMYCGDAADAGCRSYCTHHFNLAYQAVVPV